jgi:nitroreductase
VAEAMSILQEPETTAAGQALSPGQVTRLAIGVAVQAPSVHNTQPWRFRSGGRKISVYADASRQLKVADPAGREMLISCGAALFNLRVALRHLGYVPQGSILPDPAQPGLVARVTWEERVPPVDYEEQMFAAISRRHTHRGAFLPDPLPPSLLAALREEAGREGAMLRVAARDEERAALAAVVTAAEHATRLDGARDKELARWATPPGSSRRDGVPATGYPARPARSAPDFPGRDFAHGQGWGQPPSMMAPLHHSAGAVTLLATGVDQPADWIRAGQALQRVLVAATMHGVAAALHTQPLELPELREFIRLRLCGRAHPQMIVRLGATDAITESVRRPVDDVLL